MVISYPRLFAINTHKLPMLNFFLWILFAGLIWLSGYLISRLSIRENLKSKEVFIKANKWLYFLCGKPKITEIPEGMLSLRGVVFQISGLLMAFFASINQILFPRLST